MITVPIDLELTVSGGHALPLDDCELIYEPSDPYAVALIVRDDTHGVEQEWIFGRDLLTDGLARQLEPRYGDVRIWRCTPGQVHITLDSPEGTAELHAAAEIVGKFLTLTYTAVPLEHEMQHIDIDRELAAILGGA